jgi:hypothetical protein
MIRGRTGFTSRSPVNNILTPQLLSQFRRVRVTAKEPTLSLFLVWVSQCVAVVPW